MADVDLGTIFTRLELKTEGLEDGQETYIRALDKIDQKMKTQKTAIQAQTEALNAHREALAQFNADVEKNKSESKTTQQLEAENTIRQKLEAEISKTAEQRSKEIATIRELEAWYSKVYTDMLDYIRSQERLNDKTDEFVSKTSTPQKIDLTLSTNSAEDRIDHILSILKELGIEGQQAQQILKDCFDDVSALQKYERQLEVIYAKLEKQRQIIKQLEETASKTVTGQKSQAEVAKETAQLDKEKIKLKELEAQFDRTYASQQNFILQQDKTAKKVEEVNVKLDNKEAGANFKVGTDLAASGLRTLDQIAPGVAGNIGNIVTQINTARAAMQGMSSTPMKWAMGISAAVGVAATLVMSAIKQMQKAEEDRRKAFEEGIQKNKEYSKSLCALESNLQIMQDEKSTVDEVSSAKQALSDTFPELVMGWDNEGNAILANTKKIQEHIAVLKEKQYWERQSIIGNSQDVVKSYDDQIKKIAEYSSKIQELKDFVSSDDWYEGKPLPSWDLTEWLGKEGFIDGKGAQSMLQNLEGKFADLNSSLLETKESMKSYYDAMIQSSVTATDKITGLQTSYDDFSNAQKITVQAIASQSMDDLLALDTQEERLAALNNLIQKINTSLSDDTVIQQYAQQLDALGQIDYSEQLNQLSELSAAYQTLADGQQLSVKQLYDLAAAYPEVASYIAQTNDLTLDGGQILQQVFEVKRQDYIASLQQDREVAESAKQRAQEVVDSLSAQITAYEADIKLKAVETGRVDGRSVFKVLGLQKQLTDAEKNLEKDLNKYQKDIDAANAKIAAAQSKVASISSFAGSKGSSKPKSKSNPKPATKPATKSDRNEALAAELKQLDQKKRMDQLTSQEEIAWLERIQKKYKMYTDEKYDLEYRLYSAKKKYEQELEQAATERLNAEYKAIENKKALGELSAKEELAWLERIQQTFRMNKEEQMELEIKLYNLKKQLHEEDVAALDKIGDVVTEALKNKYEEQKKAEQDRINESIQSWQDWEDETCKAIQGQIDALDELEKQQESEEKRAEYEKKRQATELMLRYEKDEYQRKQLKKQLAQLDAEEQKRLDEEARKAERERLEQEMETTKETSQKQQDALKEELEDLDKTYDELTKDFALRAEAEKAIMNSTQKEIVDLIKSYAPEYDLAGQSIGQKLADGFKAKAGSIVDYLDGLMKKVQEYQANIAYTANQAADKFWADRKKYEQQIAASVAPPVVKTSSPVVNMTVQINQPVQSPIEMRRQLERVSDQIGRQLGG